MNEKRFTTVELPKPNKWGIWYDGACLSTYQVCILLNEYVDVKKENEQLKDALNQRTEQCDKYYKENEQLKQTIENICKDYEEAHGMDIRNAEWFKEW